MEQQYITRLFEAYMRGYEKRYKDKKNVLELKSAIEREQNHACMESAEREEAQPKVKMHYFKVKEDLPRVQVVLSFLHGIVSAGQCQSLLDVGSGRGVFLFPLLREFPNIEVTSLDILPHRVELLQCLHDGGINNLHPLQENICTWDAPDKSYDVVTMLEVLEHIPDTEAVVRNAVRLAKNYIIVSVPSKPDNNPEHIHLFTNEDLKSLFLENGCGKVKFMSVTNHRVMIAKL